MFMVSQIRKEVDDMGVHHVENKMGDFAVAHNELGDAHNEAEDVLTAIKSKLADVEDRSRRNNVKFRGSTIPPADLHNHIQQLIASLLPELLKWEIIVDRVHRLPKPPFLSEKVPQDVITHIHFYHVKEALMQQVRREPKLPDPYSDITLYADLCKPAASWSCLLNCTTTTTLFNAGDSPPS